MIRWELHGFATRRTAGHDVRDFDRFRAIYPCGRRYTVILDIPDQRLAPDPYIGIEEERAKVEKLAALWPVNRQALSGIGPLLQVLARKPGSR